MDKVYRIAKWSETFETSESRRHRTLLWVSLPIGFDSNGYQDLIDEFGDDAPAIYGAWCALVKLAATCTVRGTLATSKGVPFSLGRMARLTFFPQQVFERLIAWASTEQVGWLEEIDAASIDWDAAQESPGTDPGDAQEPPRPTLGYTTLQDTTKQNTTTHHKTGPASGGPVVDVSCVSSGVVTEPANRLMRACKAGRHSVPSDLLWQAAWVSMAIDTSIIDDLAAKLSARGEVKKPESYINGALRKSCDRLGVVWEHLKKQVPPPRLKEAASA